MLYYIITGLLNAVASTFFGFFVFLLDKKKLLNRTFAWYCFTTAIWSWAYCFWPIATDKESTLFWFRILHVGAILIPSAYLHFILVFLNKDKQQKKLIIASYLISVFFLLFDFSKLFIQGMEPKFSFPYWGIPGPLYHIFLVFFFACMIYCWVLLFTSMKNLSGVTQMQAKYIFAGTVIGTLGGSTNYLMWYNIPVPPYGNGLGLIFILLVAIAVIRYHLFEIRLIITELLVGIMAIVLLVLPFLMPSIFLKVITSIIFLIFCFFSFYLIQVTRGESKRRKEAEIIASREHSLRAEAERLASDLQRLDKAKNQFMLSTQHHLRSPLTVIQGYLSMIADGTYGKINAKVKEKVDASLGEAQKLIKMVNDLLDIAKHEMNQGDGSKEIVDIAEVIREIAADLQTSAVRRKLYLKFETSAVLPKISVDMEGIREALYNIVDNAIKYTEEGGVTITTSLADKAVRIAIIDTGIGMSGSYMKGLFERTFERGRMQKKSIRLAKESGCILRRK